jgi:dipeptidyl aminopeptidase/acylaminoacyl peptidase
MSRRYEVRDAQYLLGLLADEGVINPQEIGATGESYGGGMSVQLGSLKDRVELLTAN